MKKLASPWKSHYRIIEMASPVSALIRSQKDGTSKIVHVNNLRFATLIAIGILMSCHQMKKTHFRNKTQEEKQHHKDNNHNDINHIDK